MDFSENKLRLILITFSVIVAMKFARDMLKYCLDIIMSTLKTCVKNDNELNNELIKPHIRITQQEIYNIAVDMPINNIVKRQLTKSCHELKLNNDDNNGLSQRKNKKYAIRLKPDEYFKCYGCSKHVQKSHPIYVFSCQDCGRKFSQNRVLTRDLTGQIALVTGARTKLGHQIVLKLINAGATVIGTTRSPNNALKLYSDYDDYDEWKSLLDIYPESLDFDNNDIKINVEKLRDYVDTKYHKIDILINCAAQTIRARDKATFYDENTNHEENRYGDPKYVSTEAINSWQMELNDVRQNEMEEVYRVNTITPLLMIQTMMPLIKSSKVFPYVINVHAREGLFNVHKTKKHIHLNMAKAGLHMLTCCLVYAGHKTNDNNKIRFHGCDPGWISVDEYYENDRPWVVPPIDEVDGAARVLFPIFKNVPGAKKTRRHYEFLVN
jgi:NAD(P)-dependent dehydrogenase (short-subunit alcohol dehydrogenase family)